MRNLIAELAEAEMVFFDRNDNQVRWKAGHVRALPTLTLQRGATKRR